MLGHIVFVRFFLGYSEPFPFERFVHLNDNEIKGALEALRKEWLSEPANVRRLEASRLELEERQRTWSQSFLARPGRQSVVPGGLPSGVKVQPSQRGEPSFDEIASLAGWRLLQMSCGDSDHGITHRYPVAEFSTKEDADAAAEALRDTVGELARGAYAKHHWKEGSDEYLNATANPRFIVVAESKLSRSEMARANVRMGRLDGPVGEQLSPEEALLRFFLPKLLATLDQLKALFASECAALNPAIYASWPVLQARQFQRKASNSGSPSQGNRPATTNTFAAFIPRRPIRSRTRLPGDWGSMPIRTRRGRGKPNGKRSGQNQNGLPSRRPQAFQVAAAAKSAGPRTTAH
jgi:hypothetical protein